ncbi:hypothetical protein ACIGBH_40170 [Streptomyces sp. NPDC085929]|uniref:hypothetical protein n=1 Tax=Streptomyces sp. NPDC085929 TaxID=3365739 RepID=UPI0037CF824A
MEIVVFGEGGNSLGDALDVVVPGFGIGCVREHFNVPPSSASPGLLPSVWSAGIRPSVNVIFDVY